MFLRPRLAAFTKTPVTPPITRASSYYLLARASRYHVTAHR
jgi:hypothetical protein